MDTNDQQIMLKAIEELRTGQLNEAIVNLKGLARAHPQSIEIARSLIAAQEAAIKSQFNTISSSPLYVYAREQLAVTAFRLYCDFLKQVRRQDTLRCAFIGDGSSIFHMGELYPTWGTIPTWFEKSPTTSIKHRTSLEELDLSNFDLCIVASPDPKLEQRYLDSLRQISGRSQRKIPLYLPRTIERAVLPAYSQLTQIRTCLNAEKLATVAFTSLLPVPGALLECGAFCCGTSAFVGKLLEADGSNRQYHAIDTFEGMPSPVSQDGDTDYVRGTFAETSYEDALHYIGGNKLGHKVSIHKGLVQDVLPTLSGCDHVSWALIDTDQYMGTKASLEQIVPRLAANGIIIVDDYLLPGVLKAVQECMDQDPKLQGLQLIKNFFLIWRDVNYNFLSYGTTS